MRYEEIGKIHRNILASSNANFIVIVPTFIRQIRGVYDIVFMIFLVL